MRRKSNEVFLARLNRKVIFTRFEDTTWHNENTDSAEAEYFGKTINVSFPNSSKKIVDNVDSFNTFYLTLYDLETEGHYRKIEYAPFDKDFQTYNQMLDAVNAYIQSRPFTIVWQTRGRYQLLDPCGMDYTGELLTLQDARKTSNYNYKMK